MTILDYIEQLVAKISSLEDEIESLKQRIKYLESDKSEKDFSLKNFTLGQ